MKTILEEQQKIKIKETILIILGGFVLSLIALVALLLSNYLNYGQFIF